MNWIFLTLLSVLAVSVVATLQRVLMKGEKSDPYSYAIVFHILLGLTNLVIAVAFGSHFSPFDGNIYLLVLAAALWGISSIFLFKALQVLGSSEVTIFSTIRVVVIILLSVLFLSEVFDSYKIFGTILITIATVLVIQGGKTFIMGKGFFYAFVSFVLGGIAFVVDAVNIQGYDVVAYNSAANILSGCVILLFAPRALRGWREFVQPQFLSKMVPIIVFSTIQGLLYLYALTLGGDTAQVGTIRQASVIVTVLLAVIFLHERENLGRKIIAAFLVTVGVFLLS